jgi:hypothetical protein
MSPRSTADPGTPEALRRAEAALKRLGFARIAPAVRDVPLEPSFWVQEAGVPRRTFPVFVQGGVAATDARLLQWARASEAPAASKRAIVVVPSERAAEEAWASLRHGPKDDPAAELSILVVHPSPNASEGEPRWHAGTLPPREVLRLATGIVVGLFRRALETEGASQIDFSEILTLLRQRFGVDVHRSLGVTSDEDALFILYQLAQRDSYAPGDPGSSLHMLVLKPTGPAARLPWFGA